MVLGNNKKAYEVSAEKKETLKKKELDKDAEKVTADSEYPYNVRITDVSGSSSFEKTEFGVQRYIEGGNVYLFNEKKGFKEYMPIDNDDYNNYNLDKVDEEIKVIEKKLNNKKDVTNERTLKANLKTLKNRKRSLEFQGKGSYMRYNSTGKPFFEFDRVGNFKLPVFKNVDYSTLHVPSETKIKTGSELLLENDQKNGDKNVGVKVFVAIVLILMVLSFMGTMYFQYKSSQLPDKCSENLNSASLVFMGIVNKIDNVADNLENLSSNMQLKPQDIDTTPEVNIIE